MKRANGGRMQERRPNGLCVDPADTLQRHPGSRPAQPHSRPARDFSNGSEEVGGVSPHARERDEGHEGIFGETIRAGQDCGGLFSGQEGRVCGGNFCKQLREALAPKLLWIRRHVEQVLMEGAIRPGELCGDLTSKEAGRPAPSLTHRR